MSAPDNSLHVKNYLGHLTTQRQFSSHTVSAYRRDLEEFLAFADTAPLTEIKHFQIRKFAAQLHSKGLNSRSIARKLSSLRGFFDWMAEQTTLATNPVEGVKPPKHTKPLPKALSADDAVRLVADTSPGKDAESSMQRCNQAMFELLYSSGLRISELVGLDWRYTQSPGYASAGWIDFDAHEVTVTGKGRKIRSVPIGSAAMQALQNWMAIRGSLVRTDSLPLFLSERGSRISPRVAQLRLKTHAQALGIATKVHPHVLRHSFASHVLQSSGDLRAVQEMLGHQSITSTQVYTALDFQHLAQVYDAAHPRAKKKDNLQ